MENKNTNGSLEYREELMSELVPFRGVERLGNEQIGKLVSLFDGTDISEIEIKQEDSGLHLALRKLNPQPGGQVSPPTAMMGTMMGNDADTSESSERRATGGHGVDDQTTGQDGEESFHRLAASLVGIFHLRLKPNGKMLVAEGDVVRQGQIVGTIEALTILHEVEATVSGRVKEICVEDGQPVEYGQILLIIDSSV